MLFQEFREPKIVKAEFMQSPTRIYTLQFDQNITMNELKLMIQKAAHLRPNNYILMSKGKEYTKFTIETFESLFPNQKLVMFTLDIINREGFNETEFLLEMNCPCYQHVDKFLLYYCFTCGQSVCCDCFSIGLHKGHKIQDKFFYLLPSKLLVEKLFEKWGQNPYEDYKLIEDETLVELRTNINTSVFDKIFQTLRDIQTKVNNLIEKYHYRNIQLSERIRNSVRDTKIKCIKILDDLKEKMNIKDIINNDHIFLDFDKAYRKLGNLHINNFQYNVMTYKEYTKEIPPLITKLVNDINDRLFFCLNDIADNKKYENIVNLIVSKSEKSLEDKQIDIEVISHIKPNYDIYTKKRLTMNYDNDLSFKNFEKIDIINEQEKGKKSLGPNNISLINTRLKIIDNNISQNNINKNIFKVSNFKFEHKEYPNLFKPITNTQKIYINDNINNNINHNNIFKATTTNTIIEHKRIGNKNIQAGNIQSNINIKPTHININKREDKSKESIYYPFASAQQAKQTTLITNRQKYSEVQNRQSININNTLNDSYGSNSTINNINKLTEDFLTRRNAIFNSQKFNSQNNINNEISQKAINSLMNNNNNFKQTFGMKYNVSESKDSEAEKYNNIKKYLNGEFILAPITQTNGIKIVTYNMNEERAIELIFPNNLGINSFLLECGYCNFNKILYITGGIKDKDITNICLSVNISKKENQISKLSSMIYKRCCHSMISYDHYLMAVGGINLSSVERYNTLNDIWEEMPQMNYKRMYPILVIYQDYLYSFFGKSNKDEYCNTIERLKLNDGIKGNSWEMVQFQNPYNIDTRLYGCGVHVISNLLYLFGGKCNDKTTTNLFFYNFDNNSLLKEKSNLETNQYCRENKMYEFGDKLVQISDDRNCGIYIRLNAPL